MEVSVSFTDGSTELGSLQSQSGGERSAAEGSAAKSYTLDESVMGRVWIPEGELLLTPPIRIRYEKHPWMEKFEFDGVKAAPAKRTGIGSKGAKGFVKSLSTIYSAAYSDYREFGGDADFDVSGYFRHATLCFARMAEDQGSTKMVKLFCGFAENMWREGNREMLDVCMDTVIPEIESSPQLSRIFRENITDEFREWLSDQHRDYQNGSGISPETGR